MSKKNKNRNKKNGWLLPLALVGGALTLFYINKEDDVDQEAGTNEPEKEEKTTEEKATAEGEEAQEVAKEEFNAAAQNAAADSTSDDELNKNFVAELAVKVKELGTEGEASDILQKQIINFLYKLQDGELMLEYLNTISEKLNADSVEDFFKLFKFENSKVLRDVLYEVGINMPPQYYDEEAHAQYEEVKKLQQANSVVENFENKNQVFELTKEFSEDAEKAINSTANTILHNMNVKLNAVLYSPTIKILQMLEKVYDSNIFVAVLEKLKSLLQTQGKTIFDFLAFIDDNGYFEELKEIFTAHGVPLPSQYNTTKKTAVTIRAMRAANANKEQEGRNRIL